MLTTLSLGFCHFSAGYEAGHCRITEHDGQKPKADELTDGVHLLISLLPGRHDSSVFQYDLRCRDLGASSMLCGRVNLQLII